MTLVAIARRVIGSRDMQIFLRRTSPCDKFIKKNWKYGNTLSDNYRANFVFTKQLITLIRDKDNINC